MKKSLLGIFALSMSMLLAACGGGNPASSATSTPASEPGVSSVESQPSSEQQPAKSSEQQPAQSEQQPAKSSEQQPAQSEQQPAQSEQQPAQSEQQPGLSEEQPGQSEEQPHQSEEQPHQSEVVEIVFEVKVDGRVINIASRDVMGPNDDAVYDIDLTVGQTVEITKNGVALKVNGTDETVFTATIAGAHVFWVNKAGQVWVDEPELPPVEHEFAFIIGGQASEIVPSEMTEGEAKDNMAVYKGVSLEKDQVIAIKDGETDLHFWAYNETDGNHDTGATYTVPWDGEYTFWVNKDGKVWVTAPTAPVVEAVYTVEKGGDVLEIESREELEGNHAIYDIELEVGDTIVIKKDGEALKIKIGGTDATEFTATVAGTHIFYVNDKDEVYVTQPELPPVVHSFAFMVDGEASEVAPAEMSEEEARGNMAVYKGVALEKDQVVGIKDGDEDLHFWAPNGEGGSQDIGIAYTVPWDGEYTFWVNKDGEIWVDVPEEPVVEPVYTVEKGGDVLEIESREELEGNHAIYDIELAVGDTIVIKKDGEALKIKIGDTDATEFTATVAGKHTFRVDGSDQVWVDQPVAPTSVISVLVNDAAVTVEPEANPGDNKAVYKVTLAVGDTISFKEDGEFVDFYHWDGEQNKAVSDGHTFTATVAGEHTFWINKDNQIYIGQPTAPTGVISVLVNDEAVTVEPEANPGDNKAVYKVTLAVGDTISFKEDGEFVDFYHWDGEQNKAVSDGHTFTATVAGEHTFWINKDNQIYIGQPAA